MLKLTIATSRMRLIARLGAGAGYCNADRGCSRGGQSNCERLDDDSCQARVRALLGDDFRSHRRKIRRVDRIRDCMPFRARTGCRLARLLFSPKRGELSIRDRHHRLRSPSAAGRKLYSL
jgi:hypothetical protein